MSFKKILITLLALLLCASMVVSLAACGKKKNQETDADQTGNESGENTPKQSKNESQTLIIQESTFDGVFNPFFYSSAYDGDVVNMVNVGLVTMDPTGAIVAGPQYDTFGQSYEIWYTDNLETLDKKNTYEEGDYVVYEVVLKNGAKFSDGTAITAEDVLFNYYVFLDPKYDGSSTLYTLPILGLNDYRTQVRGYDAVAKAAQAALAMGPDGYVASEDVTQAQYDFYWDKMAEQGVAFAQAIVDYCVGKYAALFPSYIGKTAEQVNASAAYKVAAGMALWGFGGGEITGFLTDKTYYTITAYTPVADGAAFDENTRYFTRKDDGTYAAANITEFAAETTYYTATYTENTAAYDEDAVYYVADEEALSGYSKAILIDFEFDFYGASGTQYTMEDLTINDYVNELTDAYIEGVDYAAEFANLDSTESAGVALLAPVENAFVAEFGEAASIESIAGLKKGTKTVDGETHETFTMILTEQNPKAVLNLSITVAPKAYYTAGYNYKQNAVVTAGVELNSTEFIAHLKTLNSAPAGAGVYKFVKADGDGVTLVRNEYHYTLGNDNVTNAKIKNVYLKVVTSGKEFEALTAGDVHYANPSANASVMTDLAKPQNAAYTSILVDNLGYGYICINPAATNLNNIHTRIALSSTFNLEDIKLYYPQGLADVIYRSMSQVSWAYPENAQAIYPYDATMATAIREFKAAGYTFDERTGQFTDVPEFTFTIPSEAEDHPAGAVFLNAQTRLATIGVTVNIAVDENLIANIKKGAVAVYALAWQASADPDMYQVYHYLSSAESPKSNGIIYLQANGTSADLGTINVTKLDGTTVEMTQAQALTYLAELIEQGLKYMSPEERSPIYQKALEVLAQLNIEIPTYQRKNMFAYNNTVIDATTLSSTVTPYWSPIAELWKVSFVNGDVAE